MSNQIPFRMTRHLDAMIAAPLAVAASLEHARSMGHPKRFAAEVWAERRDRVIEAYQKIRDAIVSIPDPGNMDLAREYVLSRLPASFVTDVEAAYFGDHPDVRASEFFSGQDKKVLAGEAAVG